MCFSPQNTIEKQTLRCSGYYPSFRPLKTTQPGVRGHERFKMDARGVREHEKQVEYPVQGMAGVLFDHKLQQKEGVYLPIDHD